MRKLFLIPILLIAIFALACGSSQPEIEEPEAPAAAAQSETAEATPTAEATTAPAQAAASQSAAPTSIPVQSAPPRAVPQVAKAETTMERDKPMGGVMTRLFRDPPTLDPHKTSDTTSAFIIGEVFSGLVTLNTDLQIVPDIADRWEISEDGTVLYLPPAA